MIDRENERPDDQMKCVYMGPPMKKNLVSSLREKFVGKGPGKKKPYPKSFANEKDPDDEPYLEEVYMGPPDMDRIDPDPSVTDKIEKDPIKQSDPEDTAPLPELPKEELQDIDPNLVEGVYAGPLPPNIPPMAPVYAGPEMMNGPRNTEDRIGRKEPHMEALYAAPRRPDASRMMLVYAGPDYFANNKNPQTPMMMAYAGPSVDMSMTLAERMAAAQKEAEERYRKEHPGRDYSKETQDPEDLGKETVCPRCGTTVLQARFCSECGAALPGSIMVKCPTCGSIVPKLKFCGECGAVFPKEEENDMPSSAEESVPEA